MRTTGYSGWVTKMEKGTRYYHIYYMENQSTGDERFLYNYGGTNTNGEGGFQVELDRFAANKQYKAKINGGYVRTVEREPMEETPYWVLSAAGLTRNQIWPEASSLPNLERFIADAAKLIELATGDYVYLPDMMQRFGSLREIYTAAQADMERAESTMEVVSALVTSRFEALT